MKSLPFVPAAVLLAVSLIAAGCGWPSAERTRLLLPDLLGQARVWVPGQGLPMDGTGRLALGDGWRPWQAGNGGAWFPQTAGRAPGSIFLDVPEVTDLQIRLAYPPDTTWPRWIRLNGQDAIPAGAAASPANVQTVLAPAGIVVQGKNELRIGGDGEGTVVRSVDVFRGGVFQRLDPEAGAILVATLPFSLEYELTIPEQAVLAVQPWAVSPGGGPAAPVALTAEIEDGSGNRQVLQRWRLPVNSGHGESSDIRLGFWQGRAVTLRFQGAPAEEPVYLHFSAEIVSHAPRR